MGKRGGRKKRCERRRDGWKERDYAKVGEEKIGTRRELMRKGGRDREIGRESV